VRIKIEVCAKARSEDKEFFDIVMSAGPLRMVARINKIGLPTNKRIELHESNDRVT